jgi:PTS system mannose-specific IIB component/fructoselysine and glucoselysine-specific PTS system IIB component
VSVALVRVDDRLLHGQVLIAWGCALGVVRYLIVDDELAQSAFERQLVESCGGECPVETSDLASAPARILAEAARPGAAVVLVRDLPRALELARAVRGAGGTLDRVNLGGAHHAAGKERVHDYVYLDATDRDALAGLAALGVRVSVQDVPAATPFEAPAAWGARVA